MKTKLPPTIIIYDGRNEIVSREEPILDVPPIVVAEVVDVDVPLPVVVPIHVDDGDTRATSLPCHHPLNTLGVE